MQPNLRRVQRRRNFSVEFKKQIVKEFESGMFSVLELCKLHQIQKRVVYNWIYRYSNVNKPHTQIVEMKESSTQKLKELESKLKELERAVGQKQIYIDYLEKMMDIAKEEMGVDIKKNYGTPHSHGSGKTSNK